MRRTLNIGIGAGAVVAAVTMAAGVASAASGGHHQPANLTAVSVSKHITRAQAQGIAQAKVPHSRAAEVESDDLHDHPVWKVTLITPHGRAVVAVDKRTGKATIVSRSRSGGDHDDTVLAASLHTGDRLTASGRDRRDHDSARDDHRRGHHDGDRHDGDRHDGGDGTRDQ